jgi:hypothetical protein
VYHSFRTTSCKGEATDERCHRRSHWSSSSHEDARSHDQGQPTLAAIECRGSNALRGVWDEIRTGVAGLNPRMNECVSRSRAASTTSGQHAYRVRLIDLFRAILGYQATCIRLSFSDLGSIWSFASSYHTCSLIAVDSVTPFEAYSFLVKRAAND